MTPEQFAEWENIIDDVAKTKVPVEFIKKLVLRFDGKRKKTINLSTWFKQGLQSDEVEQRVRAVLEEQEEDVAYIEFILDIQAIAETVQPTTDQFLRFLAD